MAELVGVLRQPQNAVSRPLRVLRATKLVCSERRGTSTVYRPSDAHLTARAVEAFSHAAHERLHPADHPYKDARESRR